jgi:hypothetical protein
MAKRGLPKGRTNNPGGRPAKLKPVSFMALRLDASTEDSLTWLCEHYSKHDGKEVDRSEATRRAIRYTAEHNGKRS